MIISASRRTDIPAFYARWFMNRIREGYCTVPNPFNPNQVSRISLKPENVDIIVFWTRYARPLIPFLNELDDRGYRYYFLYTLMNNPRALEPKSPSHKRSLHTFQSLSDRIGREKVIWRYDPIVLTGITGLNFHKETYHHIAEHLKGYTGRSIISIVDIYRKARKRLKLLEMKGIPILEPPEENLNELMKNISASAAINGMEIQSCAEEPDLCRHGIAPGKCIDDGLIRRVFGLEVTRLKDPSQRPYCGCAASRDIGMYDTCLFGCVYCYATTRFDRAKERHIKSDLHSPSLTGFFPKL
jgi:DNA repair photolyase